MKFDELLAAHGPALWRAIASYAPPGAERDESAARASAPPEEA